MRSLVIVGGMLVLILMLCETIGSFGDQFFAPGLASPAAIVTIRATISALAMYVWLAPCVYLAGFIARRCTTSARFPIAVALGMGLAFTLSHLLAWAGGFSASGRAGTLIVWCGGAAWATIVMIRWAIAAWKSGELRTKFAAISPFYFIASFSIAILLLASGQAPGWLWGSEFGGFDSLSYHLQLPQEWLAAGRLAPVQHNVYSYLPSYVEAVYMQFGAAAETLHGPALRPTQFGLLAFDGLPLLMCQYFHAGCAILAAWFTSRAVAVTTGNPSSAISFAALLAVPWVVVTGSLSYNECAMLALFAGALLAAADSSITLGLRSSMVAFLVGVACGCKPTAILFCALPAGLLLVREIPLSRIPKITAISIGVGALTIAPWIIRNYLAAHNPVFPQLHSLFGLSHWDVDQFARYSSGHTFTGSLSDRVSLLFSAERGLLNAQFAGEVVALLAFIPVIIVKSTRSIGLALALGVATQILAWVFATHLQARFMMPLLVPLAMAIGMCVHAVGRRPVAIGLGCLVFAQSCFSMILFNHQRADQGKSIGNPNFLIFAGPTYFTGDLFADEIKSTREPERSRIINENLGPEAYINIIKVDPKKLLLVGDATPLYFGPVSYSTTWDRSPLLSSGGNAAYKSPSDLRAAGFTHLLVNFGELARYEKDRWNNPALSPTALTPWLKDNALAIKEWPARATVLFEIKNPPVTREGQTR